MKLLTGKAPLTQADYNMWMSLERFEDLKTRKQLQAVPMVEGIEVTYNEKTFYVFYHTLSGIVALHETMLHPIKTATQEEFTTAYDFFAVAEIGVYLSGMFIYSPSGFPDNLTWLTHTIILLKIIPGFVNLFLDSKKQKQAKKAVTFVYTGVSVCELIECAGAIIYICMKEKDQQKKNLACVDQGSLASDDIKNIIDQILEYCKDPYTIGILEGIRFLFSLGYDGMQISLGVMGNAYLETK